jgi:hypothetical protein
MEKQIYKGAEIEIAKLRMEDVIATSDPFDDEFGSDDFDNVDPDGWT